MFKYLSFEKYQGTGNDFILVDHRENRIIKHGDHELIAHLCNRRFGIGADGLILLEKSEVCDFKMVYFNADGRESTMCGNGGRCLIQFAYNKGLFQTATTFEAIDGVHRGKLLASGEVQLEMANVSEICQLDQVTFELNTGSPHYVEFGKIPDNVKNAGARIRYNEKYNHQGINVNFVQKKNNSLEVATYERGVEDETLSCGTGVTAAVLASAMKDNQFGTINNVVSTKGGTLSVTAFRNTDGTFSQVWLTGPAVKVFEGKIKL